ncbi:hypothetical protein Glove_168g276 [Diversispora epigaea]|uniref:F-box domain-containing protein n=1 Tax=Diversispora epigaea TaxID=1348612 RepID=A0A397IPU0_9GLOM|nr:hypothetical protein Glove_168g276 [Diversispora epigaea]
MSTSYKCPYCNIRYFSNCNSYSQYVNRCINLYDVSIEESNTEVSEVTDMLLDNDDFNRIEERQSVQEIENLPSGSEITDLFEYGDYDADASVSLEVISSIPERFEEILCINLYDVSTEESNTEVSEVTDMLLDNDDFNRIEERQSVQEIENLPSGSEITDLFEYGDYDADASVSLEVISSIPERFEEILFESSQNENSDVENLQNEDSNIKRLQNEDLDVRLWSRIILKDLDVRDIHSALLVNREWCRAAVPFYWKAPFSFTKIRKLNYTNLLPWVNKIESILQMLTDRGIRLETFIIENVCVYYNDNTVYRLWTNSRYSSILSTLIHVEVHSPYMDSKCIKSLAKNCTRLSHLDINLYNNNQIDQSCNWSWLNYCPNLIEFAITNLPPQIFRILGTEHEPYQFKPLKNKKSRVLTEHWHFNKGGEISSMTKFYFHPSKLLMVPYDPMSPEEKWKFRMMLFG